MPLLDSSNFLSQIFWLLLFFVIQYWLMAKFIIPSFSRTISHRKNYISNKIKQSEKMTEEAELLKKDYEEKLNSAKAENIKQMNQVVNDIKLRSDQQLKNLEKELSEDYLRYEKRVEEFVKDSSSEIDNLAIETAYNLVNRIAEKKIPKSDLNKYLN
ncbi:MAG: hypothetical protein RLN62_06910 [Rickettsiales bacterium]